MVAKGQCSMRNTFEHGGVCRIRTWPNEVSATSLSGVGHKRRRRRKGEGKEYRGTRIVTLTHVSRDDISSITLQLFGLQCWSTSHGFAMVLFSQKEAHSPKTGTKSWTSLPAVRLPYPNHSLTDLSDMVPNSTWFLCNAKRGIVKISLATP